MAGTEQAVLDLTLRPRRQLTLPPEVCDRLGVQVGDRLEVSVTDDALLVRPKKVVALRALEEIQRAFAASGITEEELQILLSRRHDAMVKCLQHQSTSGK